ncbi:MAG: hypothetical protein ACXABK_05280, partial [Candidatus Heimdallarchaeaceae archaeon]
KGNPDGIAASGILMRCLKNLELGSHAFFTNDTSNIQSRVKKFSYTTFFFIGFQLVDIPTLITEDGENSIFLVNNELNLFKEREKIKARINLFGLVEFKIPKNSVSNAGLVYFIAAEIEEDYQKYSGLAVIGGLSNKQVNPKNQELIGLNRIILEEGKESQYLNVTKGTRIAGRESQPIHLALKYSINPYFPGLTGNESACTSFVSRIGIPMRDQEDNWRTIASLSSKETKKLNDALISLLMEDNSQPVTDIYKLIGPIYILSEETKKNQTRNAEEFLWLLEGASQLKLYSLALAIVLGDRENLYDKLIRELSSYHGKSTQAIEEIIQNPNRIEDHESFRLLDGSDIFEQDTPSLVIGALVESGIISIDKPIFVKLVKEKVTEIFVRESPSRIKDGHLLFHMIKELQDQKKVSNLSGNIEFFAFSLEGKFESFIKEISESLDYYLKGEKPEEKKQTKEKTGKQKDEKK